MAALDNLSRRRPGPPGPMTWEEHKKSKKASGLDNAWVFGRLPVTIIRVALAVPIVLYWRYAINHDDMIASYKHLPRNFSSAIGRVEHTAAVWGTVLFFWNYTIWVPCLLSILPPFNLPVAAVDTTIAVYISMITHQQRAYAPLSKSHCNGLRGWKRTWSANDGFFIYAAQAAGKEEAAGFLCDTFAREWQYGLSIAILYSLVSLLEWIAFLVMVPHFRYQVEPQKQLLTRDFKIMCSFPTMITIIIQIILYDSPVCLFRECLPTAIKSRIRMARRFTVKVSLSIEQKVEIEMRAWRSKPRERYIDTEPEVPEPPLAQFLGIYDALILVAQELHCTDLLTLARTCKSVRNAVLPSYDSDRRLAVFNRYTCKNDKKSCWLCTKQVCNTCEHLRSLPRQNLDFHLESCQPYCTPCYNHWVLRRRPTVESRRCPYCQCKPVSSPNLTQRVWHGRRKFKRSSNPRSLCRDCNLLSQDEILRSREERTRSELKRGLKANDLKWTKRGRPDCGNDLSVGPKWWVCRNITCKKECVSLVHDAWVRLEPVGEETV